MRAMQFRSSAERVVAMRELLNNPILAEALVCLKDERPSDDAADNADPVVSVRLLSRQFQHDHVINLFLSLAEPLPVETTDEEPSWGIDKTRFKVQPQPA